VYQDVPALPSHLIAVRRPATAAGAVALLLLLLSSSLARAAEPPAAEDKAPPALTLSGRTLQRIAPVLIAYALCDERCEFAASARAVGVPGVGALRVVTPAKAGDGGTRMRFEIRLSPRALKLMRRALARGARLRVRLSVSAYDLAENRTDRSMAIRLRPEAPPPGPALKRS
jgi:hypothetical protein